jgi:hypothetical protein
MNNDFRNVKDNMCEICGRQATAGILDDERYTNTRIRYSCEDHYMQIHEKMVREATTNDRKE